MNWYKLLFFSQGGNCLQGKFKFPPKNGVFSKLKGVWAERKIFKSNLWCNHWKANFLIDLITSSMKGKWSKKDKYSELIYDFIKDRQILMTWSMINKYRELICKLIFRRFWVRVWGFDTMSGQHQVMYHLIDQSIK